jgi:hypothetical protein
VTAGSATATARSGGHAAWSTGRAETKTMVIAVPAASLSRFSLRSGGVMRRTRLRFCAKAVPAFAASTVRAEAAVCAVYPDARRDVLSPPTAAVAGVFSRRHVLPRPERDAASLVAHRDAPVTSRPPAAARGPPSGATIRRLPPPPVDEAPNILPGAREPAGVARRTQSGPPDFATACPTPIRSTIPVTSRPARGPTGRCWARRPLIPATSPCGQGVGRHPVIRPSSSAWARRRW